MLSRALAHYVNRSHPSATVRILGELGGSLRRNVIAPLRNSHRLWLCCPIARYLVITATVKGTRTA